ncbi:hypothetical protein [Streptomyces sp. SID4985]|uniref:hypothetical protein n=1 Tax=unclassified Streptomyces TaxID=2593676 RepID=UPI001368BC70|nr:hypothetical protein [Streptomyces sp. SID4985]MYQ44590.1 hypothetical protein [Streptomyces sp. SID4985]
MSAAAIHPVHSLQARPPNGATALAGSSHRHLLGDALRAIKVYAQAAFGVAILGEYGEEAGVVRRR